MTARDANSIAQDMIRLHGLRAQAVALERASEQRQQGNIAGFDYWQHINAAIGEVRLSRAHHEPTDRAGV